MLDWSAKLHADVDQLVSRTGQLAVVSSLCPLSLTCTQPALRSDSELLSLQVSRWTVHSLSAEEILMLCCCTVWLRLIRC